MTRSVKDGGYCKKIKKLSRLVRGTDAVQAMMYMESGFASFQLARTLLLQH